MAPNRVNFKDLISSELFCNILKVGKPRWKENFRNIIGASSHEAIDGPYTGHTARRKAFIGESSA